MKNLKNYINNCTNESIWDIEDNVESDNKEFILNEVKRFIKDNYSVVDLKSLTFVFDKEKYIVGCNSNLGLGSGAKSLTNGLFEWGTVEWWFDCSECKKLESLEGAPKTVGENFYCNGCSITSLKGAPEEVNGSFYCYKCPKLESLEGAPKIVGKAFNCSECPRLTSLKGAPGHVGWNFYCSNCAKLESLKGAPKNIGGDFNCTGCPKLSTLDGIGKVTGEIFSDIK